MLEAFCLIGLRPAKKFPPSREYRDGQKMAYWAGAILDNPEWAPTLRALGYSGFQGFFLHVNQLGKRFMNEDPGCRQNQSGAFMQPAGILRFTSWTASISMRSASAGYHRGQGMAPAQRSR
jgi:hypothetical protein